MFPKLVDGCDAHDPLPNAQPNTFTNDNAHNNKNITIIKFFFYDTFPFCRNFVGIFFFLENPMTRAQETRADFFCWGAQCSTIKYKTGIDLEEFDMQKFKAQDK